MKFESVRTPNGYEVKTQIKGTWYTIADCYCVPSLCDASESAQRIAELLNQFFNHKEINTMIRLECTRGGSNKYYEFHLIKSNGRFTVKGFYGALGQAAKEHIIYDGDSHEEAQHELQKKQREKEKKGYVIVNSDNSVSQDVPVQKKNSSLPIIWPMNAQGVKDDNHLNRLLDDNQYIAQEKLDGMRAVVHVTANGLRIFSRSAGVNDPTTPLEKTSALPHLAALQFPNLVGTILDTEILLPGVDSATLSGTIHSKKIKEENRLVKMFVFDLLSLNGQDYTNEELLGRVSTLDVLGKQLASPHIIMLPWAHKPEDKRELYNRVLQQNSEGIMLKRYDALYIQGGRPSNNWYKKKKSAKFDCVVIGFTKGAGKYNNRIGAIVFGQYVDGKLVEIGQASGMSDGIRSDMSLCPDKYIGKVITIKGMERLKSGAIRHPQYIDLNYTKQPEECIWYEGEQ